MNSLHARQQQLIEDLLLIPDLHERLAALTSYAAAMRLPETAKSEAHLVPGCLSRVWLHGCCDRDGLTRFDADADSPMVKALAAVLCHLYSGATAEEVTQIEPEIWTACHFTKTLSPTRLNGLANIRSRIRSLAESWLQAAG
jgi:cysteine desulfuration protein SufE